MLCRAKNDPNIHLYFSGGKHMTLEDSSAFPPAPDNIYEKEQHFLLTAPPRSSKTSEIILGAIQDVSQGRNVVIISCSNDRTYHQLVDRVMDTLTKLGLPEDVKVLDFKDLKDYNKAQDLKDCNKAQDSSKKLSKRATQNAAIVEKMMEDHWITILRLDLSHIAALNKANDSSSRPLAVWGDELHNKVCL